MNLQWKGINVPCTCVICDLDVKNNWHLFVECHFTKQVWNEVGLLDFFEAKAVHAESFHEVFFPILSSASSMIVGKFLMILWGIWRERNKKLWKGCVVSASCLWCIGGAL